MRSALELQKLLLEPSCSDDTSERLLQNAESAARERLAITAVTDLPSVKVWRESYELFGAKPKKY
jgi:DNA/RNA-binding domain of Phe-tRNA-synthetase-like protein